MMHFLEPHLKTYLFFLSKYTSPSIFGFWDNGIVVPLMNPTQPGNPSCFMRPISLLRSASGHATHRRFTASNAVMTRFVKSPTVPIPIPKIACIFPTLAPVPFDPNLQRATASCQAGAVWEHVELFVKTGWVSICSRTAKNPWREVRKSCRNSVSAIDEKDCRKKWLLR